MAQVTLKQIAKEAGVSFQAVSQVVNEKPNMIGEKTKNRILNIAERLNYQPNYYAQLLKTNKSNCIGLLNGHSMTYDTVEYLFHIGSISKGIQEGIVAAGNKLSFITFGSDLEETFEKSVQLVRRRIVDGLIIYVMSFEFKRFEETLLPTLKKSNLPFVVIHSTNSDLPYNNVGINTFDCGYKAAECFISQGHDTISMYIRNAQATRSLGMREGFISALQDNSIDITENTIIYKTEYNLLEAPIVKNNLPRAIFIPNDNMAEAFIIRLKNQGISVPEEVAIIGFDDVSFDSETISDLTTFYHPIKEKGSEALLMLADILDGLVPNNKIHQKILKTKLQIRKTSG